MFVKQVSCKHFLIPYMRIVSKTLGGQQAFTSTDN